MPGLYLFVGGGPCMAYHPDPTLAHLLSASPGAHGGPNGPPTSMPASVILGHELQARPSKQTN